MIKTWCSNLACHYLPRISQQCSAVTVSAQARKHTRTTHLESQKAAGYWVCCFDFFFRGMWWVFPHHGHSFEFAFSMIKTCFILCKNALKKLLSIGITWHMHEWLMYNEICDCLWGSLAPSMHTFFYNPVGHGQYVPYTVKSLPLKQLVTLMHLSPLITTSAQESRPLWTFLGIQIGCLSWTVLTVLLLSTALHHNCSHYINIHQTLPVWHTSHTKIYSHLALQHLTTLPIDVPFSDWINTANLWHSLTATGRSTQSICARKMWNFQANDTFLHEMCFYQHFVQMTYFNKNGLFRHFKWSSLSSVFNLI